ncbi:unnamed protein product, partial [Leptidea sinapis]
MGSCEQCSGSPCAIVDAAPSKLSHALHFISVAKEVPWDIIDRCALPIVLCHALAVVLSTLLNGLHISQISVFTLFLWFAISITGALWFYHNLQMYQNCVKVPTFKMNLEYIRNDLKKNLKLFISIFL